MNKPTNPPGAGPVTRAFVGPDELTELATTLVHDRYQEVVAMNKEDAKALAGRDDRPVYLGQADPKKHKFGARVYGFRGVPGCKCKGCSAP
jgi:hypothetical protein